MSDPSPSSATDASTAAAAGGSMTPDGDDAVDRSSVVRAGQRALGRLQSFPFVYVAIGLFILAYVFSVKAAELALTRHFEAVVDAATQPDDLEESVVLQIQRTLDREVRDSAWVRVWGVRASPIVIGRDGRTLIYANSSAAVPPPLGSGYFATVREAERLLPASAELQLSVPHNALLSNAMLVAYAALLLQTLYLFNRRLERQEERRMRLALGERDRVANRARSIEDELEAVRRQLLSVEPSDRENAREIQNLQREREALQAQLAALAEREEEVRSKATSAVELDQERRALEELLEEASSDLESRDDAIRELERQLKKASRGQRAASASRGRESEAIGKRLRTLYKNLEFDDRAVADIAALGDDALRLKAEESIKRLADEAENVAVRRKVGGLPGHLSIFELSFAGKGRIYYTKGQARRFRVLAVGGKASQKTDLEYLSRL